MQQKVSTDLNILSHFKISLHYPKAIFFSQDKGIPGQRTVLNLGIGRHGWKHVSQDKPKPILLLTVG